MDINNNTNSNEISLKELVLKLKFAFNYLKNKWLLIALCGVLGGIIGLLYSKFNKPIYTATCTFVLEDNKSGGLGQYAGLASIAGIDVGGNNANGIFQGDNILELYKSRIMIEKTLLSMVNIDGKNQLLIERYISFNNLQDQWKKKDHIPLMTFTEDPEKFNRKQDSIITSIVEIFTKKILSVEKLDKKLSIIKVDVATNDEQFSKSFNIKLVENVNDFYTQTKTKKSYQNVLVLQKQADSVKTILNFSLDGVASAIDATPNVNPLLLKLRVPSQKKQIDVQANIAIYSEIVKNLEVSKISLRQETPLIQIIDKPILPLPINKLSKLKGIAIGLFLGCFVVIILIFIRKFFVVLLK